MLTTLQISTRYDVGFIKSLTGIAGQDAWGTGPGDTDGSQQIIFDDQHTDAVMAAVDGYDAAWLSRVKTGRIEAVTALRRGAVERFSFDGVQMRLDESAENALSKCHAALSRQPAGTVIDFEVSRGVFMEFDLAAVGALSDAAFLHVQACFSNAKRLTGLINAATTLAELDAIDLDSGWG